MARRLGYLLRRSAIEEELRREMEGHRELMDDPRRFGNTLRLRDQSRDAWGWRWIDDLMRDFRFALRSLRHSAGFAVTATLTLALGVGANIGMFTFVNSLLLRPLYDHPDEVVARHATHTSSASSEGSARAGRSKPHSHRSPRWRLDSSAPFRRATPATRLRCQNLHGCSSFRVLEARRPCAFSPRC